MGIIVIGGGTMDTRTIKNAHNLSLVIKTGI